jgi:hypothetical protein
MAISTTYTELLTEQIIREILSEGQIPSVAEIATRLESLRSSNDISRPLFDASTYEAVEGESSSAAAINSANSDILRDLKVAYRHLLKVADQSTTNFDRWRAESNVLEARLDDLEERICSLLLLERDTEGFFNFVQDSFADLSRVDSALTTAHVDLPRKRVTIGTSNIGATRIDLGSIQETDIEFTVLSKKDLVSSVAAPSSRTRNIVSDVTNFWQERVYTNKPSPVTIELKIKLSESAVQLSRIDVDLHVSNSNQSAQVLPLYSIDNFNWNQLPIGDFTRPVLDRTTFQFPPVSAQWVKFIITKAGFDQVHKELYAYEFGVDEISFYSEGFASGAANNVELISRPLSVLDVDGNPEQFNTVTLQVTEDIRTDTDIDYYLAASNSSTFPVTSGMWVAVDPVSRTGPTKPVQVDFGDLSEITLSGLQVSHDFSETQPALINPDKDFVVISGIDGTTVTTRDVESGSQRYSFLNPSDRILNYQLAEDITIAKDTLELWRNINTPGTSTKVRENLLGWGLQEPFYSTTVSVESQEGVDIDFGDESIVLDGAAKSGKVHFSFGPHRVLVHKDNWLDFSTSGISDLAGLKTADTLYPYNHKLLIEGYPYPSDWSDAEEEIYRGFDTVAEFLMKEVSPFDMIYNVEQTDYSRFAIDRDASAPISKVFLLKVDASNPDFVNENFLLKFKAADSLFKYLRFRAVLQTEDTEVAPSLSFYRVKISS